MNHSSESKAKVIASPDRAATWYQIASPPSADRKDTRPLVIASLSESEGEAI